jgi:FkbM family methyltransferase
MIVFFQPEPGVALMQDSVTEKLPLRYRMYGLVDRALLSAGRMKLGNRHPLIVARNRLNTLLFRTVFTCPDRVKVKSFKGFDIVVSLNDQGAASILFGKEYAPLQSQVLEALLQDCNAFIDVGANYGYFSLLAATSKWKPRVVAVEPNPTLCATITESAESNRLDPDELVVLQQAVAGSDGLQRFSWDARLNSSGRIGVVGNAEHSIEVVTTTIDSIVERFGLPNAGLVAKIDVEGFELEALKGATSLFERDALIMVEISKNSLTGVAEFINDYGYRALDFSGTAVDLTTAPRTRIGDYILCPSSILLEISQRIIRSLKTVA